jgi:hypothetical protein
MYYKDMEATTNNNPEATEDTDEDGDGVVEAAAALLHAAILLRDIASAMPMSVRVRMPEDIAGRLYHYRYQAAFDGLPADVQALARAMVEADPLHQEAKRIDAEGRGP